jgi:uncharacterized protein (DUF1684 family)
MGPGELATYRANKDAYFRNSRHSPIPPAQRHDFAGLAYFDWNPELVFAVPVQVTDRTEVTIATSDGAARTYYRAGTVDLTIGAEPVTLTVFDAGQPGLFLPFRDATSGRETYGAGRYLDLHPNDDGTVTIDFNLAYNPFCAYSDSFSCALPPLDNWMSVPIEAGERI